jgi:hypothetical protein
MAATWDVIVGHQRSVRSLQALTEAPPGPLDASEGVGFVIDEVGTVTFYIDAGDGHTITADVGEVEVHVHDVGLWAFAPDMTLAVPAGSAGKRRVVLGTRSAPHARGRMAMFAKGIQASNSVVAIDAVLSNVGGRK